MKTLQEFWDLCDQHQHWTARPNLNNAHARAHTMAHQEVREHAFHSPAHQAIYQAFMNHHLKGAAKPPRPV